MRYKGELKSKQWFLKNGWKTTDDDMIESDEGFSISFDELDSILTLKEIPKSYKYLLELEDENGTEYKKEWFKKLKEYK